MGHTEKYFVDADGYIETNDTDGYIDGETRETITVGEITDKSHVQPLSAILDSQPKLKKAVERALESIALSNATRRMLNEALPEAGKE